ncbi:hypothetical protein ACLOJK_026819 [Asimina triloba]
MVNHRLCFPNLETGLPNLMGTKLPAPSVREHRRWRLLLSPVEFGRGDASPAVVGEDRWRWVPKPAAIAAIDANWGRSCCRIWMCRRWSLPDLGKMQDDRREGETLLLVVEKTKTRELPSLGLGWIADRTMRKMLVSLVCRSIVVGRRVSLAAMGKMMEH